jgi:sugar lactone lactonase YvrE
MLLKSRSICWQMLTLSTTCALLLICLSYNSYAFFDGVNNNADTVLGQVDFSNAGANLVDSQGLSFGLDTGAAINESKAIGTFGVTNETLRSQAGVVIGLDGTLWMADTGNNRVLGFANATTFANGAPAKVVLGQPDFNSYFVNNTSGQPSAAPTQSSLAGPTALAIDPVSGNLWVADTQNNRVMVFEPPFTKGMSASAVYGQGGSFTTNGGCNSGTNASAGVLCQPQGIAIDAHQNLFLVDTNNHRVLEFDDGAANFNAAPTLVIGQADFTQKVCGNAPPSANSLCKPAGIAVDSSDNVYLVDQSNQRVLEYTNPLATHDAQPSANLVFGQGNGFTTGFCDNNTSPPTVNPTTLCGPHALALEANGNLWVSDSANSRVLEYLNPLGSPSGCTPNPDGSGCVGDTVADLVLGQTTFTTRSPNFNGSNPQVVTANSLSVPEGITTLPDSGSSDVFVVDNLTSSSTTGIQYFAQNDRVLRYKQVTTNGQAAFAVLGQVNFSNVAANLVDAAGLNSQRSNQAFTVGSATMPLVGLFPLISPLNPLALAGSYPLAAATIQADAVIPAIPFSKPIPVAGLNSLESVAVDGSNHVYVTDSGNNRVLGWKNTVAFTNGQAADLVIGQVDFNSSACNQGLATPTATTLCEPMGLATDSSGNLFVADLGNDRVLKYSQPYVPSPVVQDPPAIQVFGQGGKFTTKGCPGPGGTNGATLCQPIGVALDSSNDLYVSDFKDSRILEYNSPLTVGANKVFGQPSLTSTGCNTGTNGADSGGLGTDSLCQPVGLTMDSTNDLYVADAGNSRVLEYFVPLASSSCVPAANGTGCQGDTFADLVLGQPSFSGNSCEINFQGLCFPTDVALDPAGNAFVADTANSRVVEFDAPLTTNQGGDILFGQAQSDYTGGFCNNFDDTHVGVNATAKSLCYASSVTFDKSANLYIADAGNNRVLKYQQPFGAVVSGGSVTSPGGTISGSPGSTVALGNFTVSNTLGSIGFLTSVQLSLSNPSFFSSLTLTSSTGPSTSPNAISSTTSFGFGSPPIAIPASGHVTFTLTGTLSSTASGSSVQTVNAVNASVRAVPVSFSGLGVAVSTVNGPTPGTITVSPTSGLGFLSVAIGSTKSLTLTIKNTAKSGALIGSVAAVSLPFSVTTGGGGFSLSAGQAETVSVQFAPTTAGAVSAPLVITSNDPKNPSISVKLSGTGATGTLSAPASLTFLTTKVNTSTTNTLTIRNIGAGVLHGNVGASAGPFAVTAGSGAFTLDDGKTQTVTIKFTPTVIGSLTGALPITSDDPKHLSLNVSLKGAGK